MKILFVQPTGDKRGHYGAWTSKLCQALSEQGAKIHLFTNKIAAKEILDVNPIFEITEFNGGKYSFDYYDKAMEKNSLWFWYGYFKHTYFIVNAAFKLAQREKFDVIFLTDVEYLIATLLLKRYKRYLPPVIWHVQAANFTYDTYCGSRSKKLYKLFQRTIFKSVINREVKAFAVLGEYHKEKLYQQLQIQKLFPIKVVPDGADIKKITSDKFEAKKKVGLDQFQGAIFLFLGMLRQDKGVEYLIEAAKFIKNKDCKIVIAGSAFYWNEASLNQLIEKHQVKDKIVLRVGYVPEEKIEHYYNAADAIVFPYTSQYTGGCGPLTKGASSFGKPVIVTDVADIGRVVRKYGNGLIAETEDPQSIANCISHFLCAHSEKEMIQSAYKLARDHAWPMAAKKIINLSETLVLGKNI